MNTNDANTWFTPGRPTHPDFLILADIVLAADAASDANQMEAYVARYSTMPLSRLGDIAFDEANSLLDSHKDIPLDSLMEAIWTMGFSAGVRVSRGQAPPTDEQMKADPLGTAYAGVDPHTVRYVARQRAMRLAERPSRERRQRLVLLASFWLDAVLVGLRYDERRAAFQQAANPPE